MRFMSASLGACLGSASCGAALVHKRFFLDDSRLDGRCVTKAISAVIDLSLTVRETSESVTVIVLSIIMAVRVAARV